MGRHSGMTIEEARACIGYLVRIRDRGSSQHFGRGTLLDIRGQDGVVKVENHGGHRLEHIPLADLNPWKAGIARQRELKGLPALEVHAQAEKAEETAAVSAADKKSPSPAAGMLAPGSEGQSRRELALEDAIAALKAVRDAQAMQREAEAMLSEAKVEVKRALGQWQSVNSSLQEAIAPLMSEGLS